MKKPRTYADGILWVVFNNCSTWTNNYENTGTLHVYGKNKFIESMHKSSVRY